MARDSYQMRDPISRHSIATRSRFRRCRPSLSPSGVRKCVAPGSPVPVVCIHRLQPSPIGTESACGPPFTRRSSQAAVLAVSPPTVPTRRPGHPCVSAWDDTRSCSDGSGLVAVVLDRSGQPDVSGTDWLHRPLQGGQEPLAHYGHSPFGRVVRHADSKRYEPQERSVRSNLV